ncbi:hypothetical protein FQZ97_951070 [compost metagenome]
MLRIEADTVVANEEHRAIRVRVPADLDLADVAMPGVFECVVQQVDPDLAQEHRIALDRRQIRRDAPLDVAQARVILQTDHHLAQHRVQIDAFDVQAFAPHARKRQQAFDEVLHPAGGLHDAVAIAQTLVDRAVGQVLLDQMRKAGHVAQGRTQVVRERARELFERTV